MEFFTTPNSKNLIATLRIVTIEKSELTFILILYFHDLGKQKKRNDNNYTKRLINGSTNSLNCPSFWFVYNLMHGKG